jgi:hypothetical protein
VLPVNEADDGSYVDVPTQDLRAIRRAILDLDEFAKAAPPDARVVAELE